MKRAVPRQSNVFTRLPMFEPLTGLSKYSDISADDYLRYFGGYLIDKYGLELVEHLEFDLQTYTDKDFMAVMVKPQAQRTYFIVSLKGKLKLTSGMNETKLVREQQVVALSNPLAGQVGISAKAVDCIGKANIHIITVYPKKLVESEELKTALDDIAEREAVRD